MSLGNRLYTAICFSILVILVLAASSQTNAEIIHESATMGPTNQYFGYAISEDQFIGSRFYVSEETEVTAIGGHFAQDNWLNIFGAIVILNDGYDLPSGSPFYSWEVVGFTYFTTPGFSDDIRAPLEVTLQPGWYGLVFGAGEFGLSRNAVSFMPGGGQTAYQGSSFFFWDGLWEMWFNTTFPSDPPRFVVESIPAIPPTEIHGNKFNDADGNGSWDDGELAIGGWEFYLDLNTNGMLDAGEPNAIADPNGCYEFLDLDPGTYTVAEVMRDGWVQTSPGGAGSYTLVMDVNDIRTDVNFGNCYDCQPDTNKITIAAIEDTYANSGAPDTNYGSANGCSAGMNAGSVYRAFFKFDISDIPPGNVITSAKLRLDSNFVSFPVPQLGAYAVSDSWEESTLTWNDQPSLSDPFNPWPTDETIANPDITVFDVTPDVDDQYMRDGTYSVRISSVYETTDSDASFWSSEMSVSAMRPQLVIEYEPIFGGGVGTFEDPYQIWTPEQMNAIGLYENRWAKQYELMADISLADFQGNSYNIIGTSPPNVDPRTPFEGVFDGNHHSISDFSISASSKYRGLFGYVYSGTIKNLTIIKPEIGSVVYNSGDDVGALIGVADQTDVCDCSVIGGSVRGDDYVGGLVGYSKGTFINACSSSATVSGTDYVGGLTGGASFFGGAGLISNCATRAAVSGQTCVGGFIGNSSSIAIRNSYSTGTVSGTTDVGGFSGKNEIEPYFGDIVIGCFWDTVTSTTTESAAATGLTTVPMKDQNTYLAVGWDFVGETTNGGSGDWSMPPGGGYPVLSHELAVPPAIPAFAGGTGTAQSPYLIRTKTQLNSIGHNPRLMNKHFRLISDIDFDGDAFHWIADRPYMFTGTFDGDGHTVSNIVIEPTLYTSQTGFVGTLYGSQAQVKNLTLMRPRIVDPLCWNMGAMVGLNEGGTVSNCHVRKAHLEGLTTIGGIVGLNYQYARVSDCSATGQMTENIDMNVIFGAVGGLVGENSFWSEIENSYAVCTLSGDDCLGGLVGTNIIYSTITDSYAQGHVTATADYVGGLVGRNLAGTQIDRCYSTCNVVSTGTTDKAGAFVGAMGSNNKEQYTACFYDTDRNSGLPAIGNATDAEVIGETAENMQQSATFVGSGWDFAAVWDICEGMNYPKLAWQQPVFGDLGCPDGVENMELSRMASAWLSQSGQPNWDPACDHDGNGRIAIGDFAVLAGIWLDGTTP